MFFYTVFCLSASLCAVTFTSQLPHFDNIYLPKNTIANPNASNVQSIEAILNLKEFFVDKFIYFSFETRTFVSVYVQEIHPVEIVASIIRW